MCSDISFWFQFAFLYWLMTWNIFLYVCLLLYIHFGEMSIHVFCPFSSWIIWFSTVKVWGFIIYSRQLSFVRYMVHNIFSQSRLSFHHPKVFHKASFSFWLDLMYLFFYSMDCAFGVKSKNPLPSPEPKDFLLVFFLSVLQFYILHLCPWPILS